MDPRQGLTPDAPPPAYPPLITDAQIPPDYQPTPDEQQAPPATALRITPPPRVSGTPPMRLTPQRPDQVPLQPTGPLPPIPPGAMNTGAPPNLTPAVTNPDGSPKSPLQGDEPDEESWQRGQTQEKQAYESGVGSHKAPYGPIEHPELPDPANDPDYQRLMEMQKLLASSDMTPKEQAARRRILDREVDRFIRKHKAEEDRIIRESHEKAKAEAHGIDEHYSSLKQNDETVGNISTYLGTMQTNLKTQAEQGSPADRKLASFRQTVSPLGTLKDGLHNVIYSISVANPGLTTEQATAAALAIGSPVGTEDDDVTPKTSYNGLKGKGATNYKVLRRDPVGAYLIELPTHQIIRVQPATFETLTKARYDGYAAMQKWVTDRNAPKPKGWVDELFDWATGPPKKAQ